MRILLVEDDLMIGQVLAEQLREAAYAVDWVQDGITAIGSGYANHYDAVLLDLGLPGRDGLDVLRALRADSAQLPILLITARGRLDERVTGLDTGADDYLVKPFPLDELLARLRAALRKGTGQGTGLLTNGNLVLDPSGRAVTRNGGEPTVLTRREFSLLRALIIRPGSVLSREELEDRVYGPGEEVDSNAVEFTIHRLRSKLGSDVIQNVRGVGWFIPKVGG